MIRRLMPLAVALPLLLLLAVTGGGTARADSYVPITGSGSTWSQVAIDAWTKDVRANGIVVNYTGDGSTQGRQDYIQGQSDFVSTEIPFENPPEPGQQAEVPTRPYAYMPIVAGGTSLVYHLTVAGQKVTTLHLSAETLAKIYTGAITTWSDPAIAADNPKLNLPDEPVVPVIRSDGSGTSAQLTRYFTKEAADTWCPFAAKNIGQTTCGLTSFYPNFPGSKGQVGSNGVANYVAASYGEGAIGYVEYAYAREVGYPVANILNAAGYYTQPTPSNVAVALTKAQINADLTQNLDAVYANPDPRVYPISSYSYIVVPTSTASPFSAAKGKTLSTFINYFLCGGQQKAGILGYSPLPENLVTAGFKQVARIPGAVASPTIASCNNPAFTLLQTAPEPDPCLQKGSTVACGGPIPAAPGTKAGKTPAATKTAAAAGSSAPAVVESGSGSAGGGVTIGDPVAAAPGATAAAAAPAAAPEGDVVAATVAPAAVAATVAAAVAPAEPVAAALPESLQQKRQTRVLYVLAAVALLAAVVVPAVVLQRRTRRTG